MIIHAATILVSSFLRVNFKLVNFFFQKRKKRTRKGWHRRQFAGSAYYKRKYNYVGEFLISPVYYSLRRLSGIHTHTHARNCRREKAAQRLAKRSISAKQIALPRGEPDKGARPPLHYNLIQESRRQDTAWTSISGWTRWLVKRREANVQLPPIPGLINSARLCATSSGR